MSELDKRISKALMDNLSPIKASDDLINRTLDRVIAKTSDSFEDDLSATFSSELLKIKASDDLIARTLARVNAEEAATSKETKLSALNMGYIKEHEDRKKQRTARKERIILATLAAAAAIMVVSNAAIHLGNLGKNVSAPSESLTISSESIDIVIEESPVRVQNVRYARTRVQRSYTTGAYNANNNNTPTPISRNRAF